jgi:hypothetical protein
MFCSFCFTSLVSLSSRTILLLSEFLLFSVSYLSKEQALRIFQQSGLDMSTLQQIWQLSDYDKDERLSAKEFAVGLHLIVCVTKRGQWLPHSLPPELKEFLEKRGKSKKNNETNGKSSSSSNLLLNPSAVSNTASPIHSPLGVPLSVPSRSSRFSTYLQSTFPFPSSSSPVPDRKNRIYERRENNDSSPRSDGGDDYSYLDECSPLSSSTTREQHSAFEMTTDSNLVHTPVPHSSSNAASETAIDNKAFSTLQSVKETLEANYQSLETTLTIALNSKEESQQKLEIISQEIAELQEKMKLLQAKLFQAMKSTTANQV